MNLNLKNLSRIGLNLNESGQKYQIDIIGDYLTGLKSTKNSQEETVKLNSSVVMLLLLNLIIKGM